MHWHATLAMPEGRHMGRGRGTLPGQLTTLSQAGRGEHKHPENQVGLVPASRRQWSGNPGGGAAHVTGGRGLGGSHGGKGGGETLVTRRPWPVAQGPTVSP